MISLRSNPAKHFSQSRDHAAAHTNINLQKKLILDSEFQKGGFSINYLENKITVSIWGV